jgi:hypothetical protein
MVSEHDRVGTRLITDNVLRFALSSLLLLSGFGENIKSVHLRTISNTNLLWNLTKKSTAAGFHREAEFTVAQEQPTP